MKRNLIFLFLALFSLGLFSCTTMNEPNVTTATINLINTSGYEVDMALGQFDGTSIFTVEYGCLDVRANNCTFTISNGSYDVGVREYITNVPTAWIITRENFQYQSGRTYDLKFVPTGSQIGDFRIDIVAR